MTSMIRTLSPSAVAATTLWALPSCTTATALAGEATPANVPYGHKDFYPSLERPLGFRTPSRCPYTPEEA